MFSYLPQIRSLTPRVAGVAGTNCSRLPIVMGWASAREHITAERA